MSTIESRLNSVSGDWNVEHGRIWLGEGPDAVQIASMSGSRSWGPDADFIVHAASDIRQLLDESKKLRAALAQGKTCWCGGEVGEREPGDENGLGCLDDIFHVWHG